MTGLLYFHRISDNRMAGNPLRNLRIFEKLCGKDFNKIVLTTTMWDKVDETTGATRERELIQDYWQTMIARGSTVRRFLYNRDSAFGILAPILEELNKKNALLLQKEMTDLGLKLNQTTAGRTLFSELEELITHHQKTLENIRTELKTQPLNQVQLQQRMDEYQAVSAQLNRAIEDMQRMKISGGEWLQRLVRVKAWKTPFGLVFASPQLLRFLKSFTAFCKRRKRRPEEVLGNRRHTLRGTTRGQRTIRSLSTTCFCIPSGKTFQRSGTIYEAITSHSTQARYHRVHKDKYCRCATDHHRSLRGGYCRNAWYSRTLPMFQT